MYTRLAHIVQYFFLFKITVLSITPNHEVKWTSWDIRVPWSINAMPPLLKVILLDAITPAKAH